MKKVISFLLIAALVVAGVIFVPRLCHTCDDCGEFFVGTGYEPNAAVDLVTEDMDVICEACAEEQHALAIALGQSLEDYKLPLFD